MKMIVAAIARISGKDGETDGAMVNLMSAVAWHNRQSSATLYISHGAASCLNLNQVFDFTCSDPSTNPSHEGEKNHASPTIDHDDDKQEDPE